MGGLSSNPARLRITAGLAGFGSALVLLRLAARLSGDAQPMLVPASWIDRLSLGLEPLIGCLGVVAAIGLWSQQRWGAIAYTIWTILIAGQVMLIALLVPAMSKALRHLRPPAPFLALGLGVVTVLLIHDPTALIPRPPYWPWLMGLFAIVLFGGVLQLGRSR